MRVKPVGELFFKKDEQEYRIPASELTQGPMQKEADGLQGESEDWSVIFTAESDVGDFAWYVTYIIGNEGLDIMGSDITKPDGVAVIRDVTFKSV